MSKDESSLIYELLKKNDSDNHIAQRIPKSLAVHAENEYKGTDH